MATRFANPFPRFFNDNAALLPSGQLTFFEPGSTTTKKDTYSDIGLSTANANPVILSAGGVVPDIYLSGAYRVTIQDKSANQIDEADNVGEIEAEVFEDWVSSVTYGSGGNNIVTGSDGLYYVSISASNTSNDPTTSATKWSQIKFVGVWNTNQSYIIKDIVQGSDGNLYYAISAQSGNNPISSPVQWGPVFDLVKDLTPQLGGDLDANGHQVQWSKGADVASGTALPVLTDGNYFDVTGTTTVTSINATGGAGTVIKLHFDAILILTHHAADLILPGAANITTAAGDEAEFVEYASGDYRCTNYSKASGVPVISGAQEIPLSERSSNTILAAADLGNFINITSGTFTQTFVAAASLGTTWFIYYRNTGTGDITLNPNASEQIDGLTSFIMYPGEARLIQCNGSKLTSIVISGFKKTFTSSGTFTKPPGYQRFSGLIWSGGGSGARNNNVGAISIGGGGGGCGDYVLMSSAVGATETITVGAGGAAVTATAGGNPGSNTTFGSLVTAFSGSVTVGGSVLDGAVTDATATVGNYEGAGNYITPRANFWGGGAPPSTAGGNAAKTWYGGGAGGCLNAAAAVRLPGTSTFGGDGGAANSTSNGVAGSQPGGGGGSTQTGTQSGAGGDGKVEVWGDS